MPVHMVSYFGTFPENDVGTYTTPVENLVSYVVQMATKLVMILQGAHIMYISGVLVHLIGAEFFMTNLTDSFHLVASVIAYLYHFSIRKFDSLVGCNIVFYQVINLLLIYVPVLVIQMSL